MKNRKASIFLLQAVLALMSLILISCGDTGSSGGSSSSSSDSTPEVTSGSVTVRISGLTANTASTGSVSAALAPNYVATVRVTVSALDMDTVVAEASLLDPNGVELNLEIPTGVSRLFTVEALDSAGLPMFSGQTYADIGVTAVTLDITLYDLIEQMLTAFIQDINVSGVTTADIDGYFSLNYGINDGKTREEQISSALTPQDASITGMTDVKDKTVTVDGDYIINPTINHSDGSYERETLIVTYESGVWKFKGNNFKSSASLTAYNRMITDYLDAVSFSGGIMLKIADVGNVGIGKAVITGPGLPATGATVYKDSTTGKFMFPNGDEFYYMNDLNIGAIAANASYSISIYSYSGRFIETRTEVLPYRPYMTAELSSAAFATLTNPITRIHNILSLPIGGTIPFDYAMPAAYSTTKINVSFRYKTSLGMKYIYRSTPSLSDNSVSFVTQINPGDSPVSGFFTIKTTDTNFRDMYYQWEYGI